MPAHPPGERVIVRRDWRGQWSPVQCPHCPKVAGETKYGPNPGGTQSTMESPSSRDRWRSLGKIQQLAWVNYLSYLHSGQVKLLGYLIDRTLEARGPTSYLFTSNVWLPICQKRAPKKLSLPAGPAVVRTGGHRKNVASRAGLLDHWNRKQGVGGWVCVCVCV